MPELVEETENPLRDVNVFEPADVEKSGADGESPRIITAEARPNKKTAWEEYKEWDATVGGHWSELKEWKLDIKHAVEQNNERAEKKQACLGLSIFIAFLLCYVAMLKLQLNVEDSYVMEEGMRSSLSELSTGFSVEATSTPSADGTSSINGQLSDDLDWDQVVNAPYCT
jgi:hypothetical protein